MAKFLEAFLVMFMLGLLAVSCSAQTCKSQSFKSNQVFTACNDLSHLDSFLHWNYESTNRTVNLAFRYTGTTASKWVAWGINPTSTKMIGTQALVAYTQDDGITKAHTSSVDAYNTKLAESKLSFDVPSISAEITSSDITIYATLVLPSNSSKVNHLWQTGAVQTGNDLAMHAQDSAHLGAVGTIDFASGQVASSPEGTDSKRKRRNTHGVLNAVSWGTLMPLGVMIARYLRVVKSANPAWFYLHATWQTSAYAVGIAGWATGLKLGSDSEGITHSTHRNIGLTLFIFALLQVFALLLRPKPDHKYRLFWNIYHHAIGYTVIILSIYNVYEGLDILDPEKKWKKIYSGIIIALAAIALVLECITWIIVIKRKKTEANKTHIGTNGANGHGSARL